MHFVLYDLPEKWDAFLPFTYSRPVSEIRVGIMTLREKWEKLLGAKVCFQTKEHLSGKFPNSSIPGDNFVINSSVFPTTDLVKQLMNLKFGDALYSGETWIASRQKEVVPKDFSVPQGGQKVQVSARSLNHLWEIFTLNGEQISADFQLITKNRKSESISPTNRVTNPDNIFLAPGARVEHSILNAAEGPIYICENSEIMEGCMIRGPFALCHDASLKMGAKIYGPTTIGPHSKVGGEVNNSVIFGYSNKAHDGFLGNSVLGEWCNLGADTNNSNLKNNYSEVRIYNPATKSYIETGLTFCGMFMGDHSKAGINTMFNTGTVIGFSSNVFGAGFPDKHVPSFSWGGTSESSERFKIEKAIELAKAVYSRRKVDFTKEDEKIFRSIDQLTQLQ